MTHDAQYLTRWGAGIGAGVGTLVGMIVALVLVRQASYSKMIAGFFVGALVGTPAGFVMGYLQAVVGLRHPQPEGLGLVSVFATMGVASIGFCAGGWPLAVVCGVPVWLVCGRLFGFHPGESKS